MKRKNPILADDEEVKQPEEYVLDSEVERDSGLHDAGCNTINLPSDGKFGYPAFVEYREIMVGDEEILASATAATYSKTLNSVLKSLLNDCEFYEDLKIADRDFMLLWLWATNYSSTRDVEVECAACGNKDKHVIDLTKLPQKPVRKNLVEPFTFELANGTAIEVRLNTVGDELFCEEYVRKNKKVTYERAMLARSIKIRGLNVPFEAKLDWISKNVRGREMARIRNFHSKCSFGIEATIEYTCSACGEVTHRLIPFQAEDVLRPTVPDDFGDEL